MKLRRRPAVIRPFQDSDGRWRWRIRSGNGRTIATSGESFADFGNADEAIDLLLSVRLVRGGPHANPQPKD